MLSQLTIRNFRNLSALDLEFPPGGAVIIGENGQGKTNLLEAIYYLVLFRSLRGAKDGELVRFGSDAFFVGGTAADHRITAGYEIAGHRKKVTVDGVAADKLSEVVGRLLAVPFSPADAGVVGSGPGARRRYIDVLLSVSDRVYLTRLTEMRAALRQRNAALRHGRGDEARAFDAPLAEGAAHVAAARRRWVDQWSARYGELCAALGESDRAEMRYHAHQPAADDASGWRERLAGSLDRDLRRAMTTVGPHRDDLKLALGGRELRVYGSAGQHRTAAIALRVLEAETLAAARGGREPPIGLFDDVFAELDEGRQERLLRLIQGSLPGQAIVAAPRDAEVPTALFDRPRWQIKGGRIVG